jgi:hypothetical protein
VVEDPASGAVVGEFLQGQGSPADVLSESLPGFVVAAIEAYGVVDGEPGVLPAQEGLGEVLRDEVKGEEQAEGAPAHTLGEARRIVDGQVVELPGGVESALKDESVEVGVEPKRVAERLIGHDGGGGDGSAGRGGENRAIRLKISRAKSANRRWS